MNVGRKLTGDKLNSGLKVVKSEFRKNAFLANMYRSIPAKFQEPRSIRSWVIARTHIQTARENSKTEQPFFWFWVNHLV